MVKKKTEAPISTDDGGIQPLNNNGKRHATEVPQAEGAKKVKSHGLYRQPTVRELNRLQETETLFNSNLFRLQVEEVLEEVKLKEKTQAKLQKWFDDFKKHMEAVPKGEKEYDLSENTLFKELKVKSPVGTELKKTKCSFEFHKFSQMEIIGSYALDCPINSKLRVDIQITVPAETYTKNDSVNYRYHKKRAAYLAYIASHLKDLAIVEDLQYSWLNGSESKPVLDFKPQGKLGSQLSVRIHLSCDPDAYKLHRFSPARNNLREAWLFNTETSENATEIGPPTPYYNSSILQDLTASANQEFLKQVLEKSDNLKQAIVLLKIWLRQRNLKVSGHIVSMLVAHLVQTKRINNIMSSYQIVRNVWISLKTSEWDTKGVSLSKDANAPSLQEFLGHFSVVFLDKTGYYNMCWQMCKGTYQALRRESALAVEMLDNTRINSFLALFMTPVQPLLQFDHIVRFKNVQKLKESVYKQASKETKVNYGTDRLALVTDAIHSLLVRGLGDRAQLVLQHSEADFSWPVKEGLEKARQTSNYQEKLYFGLILSPENAFNIVEKGPPANLPEAEVFRAFWGERSELRRFQDGSITEACVFPAETLAARRLITKQMVAHLLKLKYGMENELFYVASQLDGVLVRKGPVWEPEGAPRVAGTGEEDTLRVLQAFDELRRDLRALTDCRAAALPLDITAVYGTSPVFSYCDPLPPTAATAHGRPPRRASAALLSESSATCPPFVPVCKVVLELSHSGKWPGSLYPFRVIKTGFYLNIARELNKQFQLLAQASPTGVDVMKNGVVFRLVIAHSKEITLLRKVEENGVTKYRDSEESLNLLFETVVLPKLRGALHGLHTKHPAFGPTASLVKRWLSSHLLDEHHFPAASAELLTAAVFVQPQPLTAPLQPLAGFARALRRLAVTDWRRELVVLDFNEELTPEEIAELERRNNEADHSEPRLHIVTPYDGALGYRGPSPQVLARAQALAKSALAYLESSLMDEAKDNVLGIFVPSLAGFDLLIHLDRRQEPLSTERVHSPSKARPLTGDVISDDVIPPLDHRPCRRYLEDLRHAYDDFALFFYDSYGGETIAVLWKPNVDEKIEFQVATANAMRAVREQGAVKYTVNKEAIISDFKLMGEGLVTSITVNT